MKKTLVLDLDGVIATGTTEEVYSDEAGWAFEKCEVMEGAKEGLELLVKSMI
jgi:histidinol phosphatase-like enzyme